MLFHIFQLQIINRKNARFMVPIFKQRFCKRLVDAIPLYAYN